MTAISRSLAILVTVWLLLGLESPLLQQFHLSFFAPDLALLAVVWVSLHLPPTSGMLTCLLIGFLKDGFVMAVPIGMHMEIFVVLYLVGRFFAGRILVKGLVTLMVTSVFASLMATLLFLLLTLLFDKNFTSFSLVLRLMLPVALVTAPFSPILFYLLDRIDRVFHRKTRGLGVL